MAEMEALLEIDEERGIVGYGETGRGPLPWKQAPNDAAPGIEPALRVLLNTDNLILQLQKEPFERRPMSAQGRRGENVTIPLYKYEVQTKEGEVLYKGETVSAREGQKGITFYDHSQTDVITFRNDVSNFLCCCNTGSGTTNLECPPGVFSLKICSTSSSLTVKDTVDATLLHVLGTESGPVLAQDLETKIGTLLTITHPLSQHAYFQVTFPKDLEVHAKLGALGIAVLSSQYFSTKQETRLR